MFRAFVVLLLLGGRAHATEPPCHVPTCMHPITAVKAGKRVLVSKDKKTTVTVVEAHAGPPMVLVEVRRDGKADHVIAAFVIAKQDTVELVPFGGSLAKPMLVFQHAMWATATSARFDKLALDVDPKRTKSLDSKAMLRRYLRQQKKLQADQAKEFVAKTLAANMQEIVSKCGTNVEHGLDWSKLSDDKLADPDRMSGPEYICEDIFHDYVMTKCESKNGRDDVAARLRRVVCRYKIGGQPTVTFEKGLLTIEVSITANRERQGSRGHRALSKLF